MTTLPRVEEWRVAQQAQGLSQRTIEARISRVYELADHMAGDPEKATVGEVVAFMASVTQRQGYKEETVGPSTLATYHSHLRAWFKWLVKREHRIDNPMDRIDAPKADEPEPRPVTDRELLAIFDVPVHKRTKMMLLLAAFEGLRVHEIAKVRGEHINLHDNLLRVIGKGRKDKTIPIHPLVAALAPEFPVKGYWFPTNARGNASHGTEGPILARSVSSIVADVFDRAGVDGGAHRLRHWYATVLINGGASTRLVQTLLRHNSIQSTERYTLINPDDQQAAVLRITMPGMPAIAETA